LAAALALATFGACAGVMPGGLALAGRLDPLTTAPGAISAAVGVPRGLRLADGDAAVRIALYGDGPDAPALVDETVPLEIRRDPPDAPAPHDADEIVYVGTFSEAGAARLAAAQARIRALRASGVAGRGALSIAVTGGCLEGPAPDALRVSTWLRTDPRAAFVRVTRRVDMARALGGADATLLRSCGA
jgi:hypothetical protein